MPAAAVAASGGEKDKGSTAVPTTISGGGKVQSADEKWEVLVKGAQVKAMEGSKEREGGFLNGGPKRGPPSGVKSQTYGRRSLSLR